MRTFSQQAQPGRGRSGNYSVIFGLSMVVIIGFAALAIDVSYLRLSALQAQNAADAGAHAAMVAYRSTLDESHAATIATAAAAMNFVAGSSATLDQNTDIEFGGWDYNLPDPFFDASAAYINAAQITVRRTSDNADGPVQLMLAPIFGHDTANVSAIATGALRFREVMIALDISASFLEEFEEARQGTLTYLEGMWRGGAAWPGDRIGMTVYHGDAVLYTALSYVDTDYATIADDWLNDLDWCNVDYPPYGSYLGGYYWHPSPMIDCTYPEDPSVYTDFSGLNPGQGILYSADELLNNGDPTALKTIILITDGAIECPTDRPCSSLGRYLNGIQQANNAAADNISIHTVFLDVAGNAAAEAYVAGLVRGYGEAYTTEDPTDLSDIMEELVALIPVALVQ